jgi:chloramphenicol O-acetyltransferase
LPRNSGLSNPQVCHGRFIGQNGTLRLPLSQHIRSWHERDPRECLQFGRYRR